MDATLKGLSRSMETSRPAIGGPKQVVGMNGYRYDFERPIAELEHRLQEAAKAHPETVKTLEAQLEQLKRKVYGNLTPW